MKTWEMIKEITEDPSKEFVRELDGLHIKTNKDGELIWDSGYQFIRLGHEWKEVKKPVDFIEAVKALQEGKNIYSEYGNRIYHYRSKPYKGLIDLNKNPVASYEILHGEWYIED